MFFPVRTAWSATLAYLARHAVGLLKALWLPALLLTVLQMWAAGPLLTAFARLLDLGPNPAPAEAMATLGAIGKWMLVVMAGGALLYPMLAVASLRHLVRGDPMPAPFYFRYGGDELRVLAAYVLLTLMLVLVALVAELSLGALIFLAGLLAAGALPVIRPIIELVINVATWWFQVRLSLLFPAAIATRTTGFGAAWKATRYEALRLFLFWIAIGVIYVPLALLLFAPVIAELYPLFEPVAAAGADPEAQRTAVIPLINAAAALYSPGHPLFVLNAALMFVATIVITALVNVAAGTAWRYLTDRTSPASPAVETRAAA